MKRIVVVGAGIGGVPMAFELKALLGKTAQVIVVGESEWFQFVPSNPWVAVNWRRAEDIRVDLREVFPRFGIEFNTAGVARIIPSERRLTLRDSTSMFYDYLVIATGPQLAFDEIEGLGPDRNTASICHVDHAVLASKSWAALCEEPGPVVIGAAQGASCFGPAYEFALIASAELRKRRIRDRVPMTFVTPEPYIGHLGLGGVGDTKSLLESALRERDIKWITNARIDRVLPDSVEVSEHADDGTPKRRHTLPARLSMFIPAFRGVDCLKDHDGKWIEGLVNPRGFVVIDKHQRNPAFKNIFAVGVCTAIPPVEATPVPVGTPKTGYMIESMVTATARNIQELVQGKEPSHEATWNAVCLADFGDEGVAFIALPQIPPRNVNWSGQGYWVHLAKVAFEKYFLNKVRNGTSEPAYEKFIMRALGIEKLKA